MNCDNEFDDLSVNPDNIDKSDSKNGYVAKHPTRYNE